MLQSPRERIAILKELYAQRKTTLRPLDDYLKHYGHISPDEYGEVYAMTHFWVFASKSGKDRFKLYWTALKHRENGTEAFERIFMADMIKAQGGRDQAIAAAGCPGQVREDPQVGLVGALGRTARRTGPCLPESRT